MAEKKINSRIVHKHATEADWKKATTFTPMQGEMIVYDIDDKHNYERIKIGDGKTLVNALPFSDDALKADVSEQISQAFEERPQVQVMTWEADD